MPLHVAPGLREIVEQHLVQLQDVSVCVDYSIVVCHAPDPTPVAYNACPWLQYRPFHWLNATNAGAGCVMGCNAPAWTPSSACPTAATSISSRRTCAT